MAKDVNQECFIRSVEGLHPDIVLQDGAAMYLGRGPQTKIKDLKCSRNQIKLTANLSNFSVDCQQKGGNPSKSGKTVIRMEDHIILRHMDTIELLEDQYKYLIIFNPPPPAKLDVKTNYDTKECLVPKPLKRSLEKNVEESSKKKICVSDDRNIPWFHIDKGSTFKNKETLEWWRCYDGKLLVMSSLNAKQSSKIAAFDIDGTIITTQSGKVFPTDKHDWKLLYSEIPGKLKHLHSEGYRIVFITNQAGIGKGKVKESDFCEKAENIGRKVGVPLTIIISTAERGFFRKPRPGIWYWLRNVANNECVIDVENSFYCGDAAGRKAGWIDKRKKDFSCSDRLFAANLDLTFYTPEEYFMGHKATKLFDFPGFDPRQASSKALLEPQTESLVADAQEMVMMVGIQGSGKSHLSQLLEEKGYIVASNDRSGGKDKTLKICRDAIVAGKSVVVDNTHRDKESRKDYIFVARQNNIHVRCFRMTTDHDHARHNNIYRELTDPQHVRINEMLFNSYRSKFEEPDTKEGFSKIVKVNFLPSFPDSQHENLYRMHLLEK